jgi:hypothetical protein
MCCLLLALLLFPAMAKGRVAVVAEGTFIAMLL